MPETTYSLVYMSKSSICFSQSDLTDLLNQSRTYNSQNQITGLLLFVDGNFMQLLEGSQPEIETLFIRIKNDARHQDIQTLEAGPASSRLFPEWSMAFLDFASPQVRGLPGYSTFLQDPLSPEDLAQDSSQSTRLLQYFKAVMTASDSSVLRLADSIAQDGPQRSTCGASSEAGR